VLETASGSERTELRVASPVFDPKARPAPRLARLRPWSGPSASRAPGRDASAGSTARPSLRSGWRSPRRR